MASTVTYTIYQFTPEELNTIHQFMEVFTGGPVIAYRWYKGLKESQSVRTGDVEDFAISFYTQYNRECKRIY